MNNKLRIAMYLTVAVITASVWWQSRQAEAPVPVPASPHSETPREAQGPQASAPGEARGPQARGREDARGSQAGAPGEVRVSRASAAGDVREPQVQVRAEVGFRSRQRLVDHYEKHGTEFADITMAEYLRRAQALRDVPAGGDVLEIVRNDGVITRFDKSTGAFLAFNRDLTIRTFFRPRQGETYFRRQARRRQ